MSRSIAPVFITYIEYGHNSGFVTSPVQMTSPVIPNERDVQDHMQWHAVLEHLTISADALVPMYMIEYFETVYQRCLIIPNDSKHVTVDHSTKHMKLPVTGYENMSLMYSEEAQAWYTFIQSAKHPDHVAMIQIHVQYPRYEIMEKNPDDTACYGDAPVLPDWNIMFPFMHRYIMQYEQAFREEWVMKQVDPGSGHSMGQISQFDNTTTTTSNIVSKLYNAAPRVVPPDIMNQLYKKYCL